MLKTVYEISFSGYKDLYPIECGRHTCAPGYKCGPHIRGYFVLHTIHAGKGSYTVHGKTYHLSAGDSFMLLPDVTTEYQADARDPWQYSWVGFSAQIVLPDWFYLPVWHGPSLEAMFLKMIETEAQSPRQGREARLCSLLWQLVALAEEQQPPKSKNNAYVQRAQALMQNQFIYGIQVSDIATRVGLERSYFSHLFKKETGVSPQKYLTDIRMRRAAVLLKERDTTPGIAALSVGYPDVFSFSRMFRQYYGVSPNQYKKEQKNSTP